MQRIPRALVHVAVVICGCGLMTPVAPPARTTSGAPGPTDAGSNPPPTSPGADPTNPAFPGYRLAFDDEFDGSAVDEARWNVRDGAGVRDCVASRLSLSLDNGILTLRTYTDANGVHHVGFIHTRAEWSYGYFETRVRLDDAPGEWCSFFLWPDAYYSAPGDPATAGVEIDVFEHRVIDDLGWNLQDMVQIGDNWNGAGNTWQKSNTTLALPDGGKIQGAWNTFGVLWTETGYTFYANGVPYWTSKAPPTAVPAPVYLDCEVLVDSWAGKTPPGGYGSLATSTTGMQVDWVRIWQKQP